MNAQAPHCVVIGAGTVGASCAWQLVQDGLRVTLVDRELPGQATSFGNAGCISPSQLTPFSHPGVWKKIPGWLLDELGPLTIRWRHLPWLAPWLWRFWRAGSARGVRACVEAQAQLMHRVTADFDALLGATGLEHYRTSRGLIYTFETIQDFQDAEWQFQMDAEFGFDWGLVGPAELKIMAPAIRLEKGVALHIPSWQHLSDPGQMTADIANAAISAGAQWLHEEVRAVRALPDSVRVETTTGQAIEADHLVIAAGPWSNQLARQLDYTLPMTPKRGYHSMIGEPGIELGYPVMSGSRNFVMTPMADGLRLAGTAEFARLDAEPNYRRAEVLMQHAARYFPDLQYREVTQWMGQRPMMVDSLPVISPSPSHANVFYAFGHGHYGLTQGPTTGRVISSLVRGEDPGLDLAPYSFDRFKRK